MSDIDVVYVQDPFRYLHRDTDVEGTTDGWDAATAYLPGGLTMFIVGARCRPPSRVPSPLRTGLRKVALKA